jgi:hypothetical protein
MNQTSTMKNQRQVAEGRREALNWLARRLSWERRLGELRPSADEVAEISETKQAA